MSSEVVMAISWIASFAATGLLKFIKPAFWQTTDGETLLKQVPVLIGALVGWLAGGTPESGMAGGALARLTFEVPHGVQKSRAERATRKAARAASVAACDASAAPPPEPPEPKGKRRPRR